MTSKSDDSCNPKSRVEWVVELIKRTPIPIPQVRRMAVIESCRAGDLNEIFWDSTCESPYLSEDLKQQIAKALMANNWDALPELVGVPFSWMHPLQGAPFQDFRTMTMGIFCKSRKIRQLPLSRRREIGKALMSLKSREDIVEFLFESLEHAQILDPESCSRIANDVLEKRYYRLLLPDRFDCDEIPRLGATKDHHHQLEDEPYCAICLGSFPIDGRWCTLLCTHSFCLACIQDLAKRHGGDQFPCPSCLSIESQQMLKKDAV
mmetsp:Transcript_1209/g.1845  ORF Transcript_1209/g.1845 Transcript_1209/m.1845 type:complete len:263 (-) Transcript_1209:584-1372(-)